MKTSQGWMARVGVALVLAGCGGMSPAAGTTSGAITFTEVTKQAGLPAQDTFCTVFQDLDNDGKPDLVVAVPDINGGFAHEVDLYRNTGDGKFEKHVLMVPEGGVFIQGCATTDYDNDGKLDLLFQFDLPTAVALYHNMGSMKFEDATMLIPDSAIPHVQVGYTESSATFDYDNDGYLDILLAFFSIPIGPEGGCLVDKCTTTDTDFTCSLLPGSRTMIPPVLLHNKRGTGFEVVANPPGADAPPDVNAIGIIDWNGDGFLDVYYAVDFGPSRFYMNQGGKGWKEILEGKKRNPYSHGMGVAFADFNHDALWDYYFVDGGPDQLYYSEPGPMGENFSDVAFATGVGQATRLHSGWCPIAGDFNQDGWADVFTINPAIAKDAADLSEINRSCIGPLMAMVPQADYVFTNQKGTKFDVALVPNDNKVAYPAFSFAAAADYDGDGDLDIAEYSLVANPSFRLLRNDTTNQGNWLRVTLEGTKSNRIGYGAVVTLNDGTTYLEKRAVGSEGSNGRGAVGAHFGLGTRTTVGPIHVHWPSGVEQDVPSPIAANQVLHIVEPK